MLFAALAATAAKADLPAGWTVHTFTGQIREIEPAGGVLACATDGGLLLFDPQTQAFAPAIADAGCTDGDCLTSNHLTSISRDANGNYWMGTFASGVVVFRPGATGRRYGRFFELNSAPGRNLLADSVRCIEAWRAQTVYAGTSRGVAQIDLAGAVESHNDDAARRLGSALKGTIIRDLAVDSAFVWVATDSGLSRYDRRPPYTVQFLPDSLTDRDAQTVEILGNTVYAGTGNGIYTWQEASHAWRRVRNVDEGTTPTPAFVARSIARLPDGRVYVGSTGTVWFFNRFVWGQIAPPPLFLLGSREFSNIVTTGDTAWTCQHNTDGEGAFLEQAVLGRNPTWVRLEANALPPSEVKALDVGADGTLWIGTRIGGVSRLDTGGRWCTYNGNDATVRSNMTDVEGHVSALVTGVDGRAWFHALPQPTLSNPVDMLRGDSGCGHTADQWDHIGVDQHRFGGRYWRALRDGEGNLFWLADGQEDAASDIGGGFEVVSADGTRFTAIREDTLGGRAVGALAFDTETGPWARAYVGLNGLGTHGLLQWIRSGQLLPPGPLPGPQNFSELSLPDSLSVSEFRDLAVQPGTRTVWVGTDNGVLEYDAVNRLVLTVLRAKNSARPGLLSGDVKDLQFDRFGNLWVATVKGLNRLRLDQRATSPVLVIEAFTTIEAIRERNAASSVGQLYDPRRALAPLPAPKVNALAYDTARDRLYCGTEGGVAVIDVAGLSRRTVIPVDQAVLYPNPVRADAGHHEVRITKLSEPATVTIYTLEGNEVCSATDREDGDVVWTLGTPSCLDSEGNFLAASGAYLVRITTRSGSTLRTLVVIR